MKRHYISPIVGTGSEADPYRPKIADYGVTWSGVIASDPITGRPARAWSLVAVESEDHTNLLLDSEIDALPNIALDTLVSTLPRTVRDRLKSRLDALGVDTTGLSIDDPIRRWLRVIGRHLEPSFVETRLGIR